MELLERTVQLETLAVLLEAAAQGSGALVWLAGEAGAGKTSVVNAFAHQVGNSATVLKGSCDPLSTPRALGPFLDILESLDPLLMDQLVARSARDMFTDVLRVLRTREGSTLMIIEDVHWGDDATFDFIRYLGRRVSEVGLVVVCTYRDDEVVPDHPLAVVLGQLATAPGNHRMHVGPLSLASVEALATGNQVEAADLHRITGGNAFYVTEVIASGGELPETVQDAVMARVALLGTRARRFVEATSISPGWLEREYAESIADSGPGYLEEAMRSGVIVLESDRLRFRHEIAREAVIAAINPLYRLELNRQLIEILADEDPPPLARLAHHAGETGDIEAIAAYVPAAAFEAIDRGAHREAVSLFALATSHPSGMSRDELAAMRLRYAGALRHLGQADLCFEQAHMAADHYRDTDQPEILVRALGAVGSALWDLSDTEGSSRVSDERIAIAESRGLTAELNSAYFSKAWGQMLERNYRQASDGAQRSLEIALASGDERRVVEARMLLGCVETVVGDPATGIPAMQEALNAATDLGWKDFLPFGYTNVGSGAGEARWYRVAEEALEKCIVLGRERDMDLSVAYSTAWQARISFEQARYSEVVDLAEAVESLVPNEKDISRVTALGALGRALVRRGDEGGRQALERGVSVGVRHELQHVWSLWCGIAEHSWLWDRPEAVASLLRPIYERALDTDSAWARGEVGFWMWRTGAIDEPPAGAAQPFKLQMAGDWKSAAAAWREIGCPYEVGLALMDGDNDARMEALHIFDSLGTRPVAMKLRGLLRGSGVTSVPRGPIRGTVADPWLLTPKQREVADLVAEGLTNAEIADRLFISKKTVEHHIAAIFQKLNTATRSGVAAVLRSAPSQI